MDRLEDGELYCQGGALDDAAAALARRFASLRKTRWTDTARAASSETGSSDPSAPPFVRHAAVSAHLSTRRAGWETAAWRVLAEDAAAVAGFVRAEAAAVLTESRVVETAARRLRLRLQLQLQVQRDGGITAAEVERWWRAADQLAARAEATSELLAHNVEAIEYLLCRWTEAFHRGGSGVLDDVARDVESSDSSDGGGYRPSLSSVTPSTSTSSIEEPVATRATPLTTPLGRAMSTLDSLTALDVQFEAVVLSLSAAFAALRALRFGHDGDEACTTEWEPPSSFERKTTKYWVEPKDVVRLKLAIVRHLPVLVFEGAGGKAKKAVTVNGEQPGRDSGMITSVYFDNAHLDVYHSRLEREQGATLVRTRWYGDDPDVRGVHGLEARREADDNSIQGDVFVERKTHHESWSLDGSVKERFRLDRCELAGYLSGRLDIPSILRGTGAAEAEKAATLAEEVVMLELRNRSLEPSVRTEYRRTAFQLSSSNTVRMSLDTRLRFTREDGSTRAVTHAFPYAILEVKLQEASPDWIEEVMARVPVIEVHKFSKFLHGTVVTGAETSTTCRTVRRVPHWCTEEISAGLKRAERRQEALKCARGLGKTSCAVGLHGAEACPPMEASQQCNAVERVASSSHPAPISAPVACASSKEAGMAFDHVAVDMNSSSSSIGDGYVPGNTRLAENGSPPRTVTMREVAPHAPSRASDHSCFRQGNLAPHRRYVPIKIEPKTFFANERTLLQWLSMSVLILFMSLALLSLDGFGESTPLVTDPRGITGGSADRQGNSGGSAMADPFDAAPRVRHNRFVSGVCGAILAPVAVVFMVYALVTYMWRTRRIARREPSTRYDDVWGPFALVVMLVTISTAAIVLAISAHDWGGRGGA